MDAVDLSRFLSENLGPRLKNHPNAKDFSDCAARALLDWREMKNQLFEMMDNAFPSGSEQRKQNGQRAVNNLARSVRAMTPAERRSFAISCGLHTALGLAPDAGLVELDAQLDRFFGALRIPEPVTVDREAPSAGVARLLSEHWVRQFERAPGTSRHSPFVNVVRTACQALDIQPPKADTVAKLI